MALRVGHGARQAVLRRCGGACERCRLEWPWALYLFQVDCLDRPRAANLVALCGACSLGVPGPFTPLLTERPLRERLRDRNNRRTGAAKLTESRRRRLIVERGGHCQACGISGAERQLDVHHVLGVFRGGDDSPENLLVLCFACHHHLQPCSEGCGRWAKRPATVCRRCLTERRLGELSAPASAEQPRPERRGAGPPRSTTASGS